MTTKKWSNIARLIRTARIKKGISQEALSVALGYKNAQMISNIERMKAGLPPHAILELSRILEISEDTIVSNMVSDFRVGVLIDMYKGDMYTVKAKQLGCTRQEAKALDVAETYGMNAKNLRTIFTPSGESKLITADYKQHEQRILSHEPSRTTN